MARSPYPCSELRSGSANWVVDSGKEFQRIIHMILVEEMA